MLMPHRIAQNVKYHLIYTAVLIVIMIVGLQLFQTLVYALFGGSKIIAGAIIWVAVGCFYALPERNRMEKDSAQMREFRKAYPDGTYQPGEDARQIVRSEEFWSDIVSIFVMVIAAILIVVAAIAAGVIAPPILIALRDQPWKLLLILPASVLLSISYGFFHLYFTVDTHRLWDETRLHLSEEKHMEAPSRR